MAKATTTQESKTYTPKELAAELEVDPKRIRAFLRSNEVTARALEAKNTSWTLTEEQAELVRERFIASDDDEAGEE